MIAKYEVGSMKAEVITACGWCGEVLSGDATEAEVAEAMESGTNEVRGRMISHGICGVCKANFITAAAAVVTPTKSQYMGVAV